MKYAVTMGDAAGVGPEILLKAFTAGSIQSDIVVYGDLTVLRKAADHLEMNVAWDQLSVQDMGLLDENDWVMGREDLKTGRAAREYVVAAAKAALAGDVDAIVTLPMNKAATQLSDTTFTGHTELIAEVCGVENETMMLASDRLIVTHVSTHVSLQEAIRRVTRQRVKKVIELTHEAMSRFIRMPRIGVAGLNPHAGEGGLFGVEENEAIIPAIKDCQLQGIRVSGPKPADTIYYQVLHQNAFDAVVAMYHDQGHVAMKTLDFEAGVNISLGLPIIRTSVDHGTAFDIAYQGIASTKSFLQALDWAAKLARSGT